MTGSTVAIATTIAAAAGAVIGAAISAIVTYRVTNRQVVNASNEARKNREHERSLAREERQQARLLDAYVATMRHVAHWGRFAEWKRRDFTAQFDPPIPEPTPDTIDFTSEALVALVASAEVQRLVAEFNRQLISLGTALGHFRVTSEMASGEPALAAVAGEALSGAKEACTNVIEAGIALRSQLARELTLPIE
jgi:HAMP domain-containing protein